MWPMIKCGQCGQWVNVANEGLRAYLSSLARLKYISLVASKY